MCIRLICISNKVIYRIRGACSATRGRFLDERIRQRTTRKWGKSIDSARPCKRKHRTSSRRRTAPGPHSNDSRRTRYRAASRKSSPLCLCFQHSPDMDAAQLYRPRNRTSPSSAICWQMDGQSSRYRLWNAKHFSIASCEL